MFVDVSLQAGGLAGVLALPRLSPCLSGNDTLPTKGIVAEGKTDIFGLSVLIRPLYRCPMVKLNISRETRSSNEHIDVCLKKIDQL